MKVSKQKVKGKEELPKLQLSSLTSQPSSSQNIEMNLLKIKKQPESSRRNPQKSQFFGLQSVPKQPQTSRVRSKPKCQLRTQYFKEMNEKYDLEMQKASSEYEQYEISKSTFERLINEFPSQAKSIEIVKSGYEEEINKVIEVVNGYLETQKALHVSEKGFNSDLLMAQQKIASKRKILTDRIATAIEQKELTTKDIEELKKEKSLKIEMNKDLVYKSESSVSYIEQLNSQLATAEKEYNELKKENDSLKSEIDSINKNIENSCNDIDNALNSIYNTNNTIANEYVEINDMNSKIGSLKSKIRTLHDEIDALKIVEKDKQKEYDDAINETEKFKQDVNQLKASLMYLNGGQGIYDDPISALQFYLKYYASK